MTDSDCGCAVSVSVLVVGVGCRSSVSVVSDIRRCYRDESIKNVSDEMDHVERISWVNHIA